MSDLADSPMKRVYGKATASTTATAVATTTRGHGRGAPTETQATRATRKSGAIVNALRSWMRPANSDAKAATTIVVQTENDTVAAKLLQPGREPAGAAEQNKRRRHGYDAEVEGQLLRVPEPVAKNGGRSYERSPTTP